MYVDFAEEEVSINSEVVIKGTLSIPHIENKKLPAVIIVNGSNTVDRDGSIKTPRLNVNIYKALAHRCARLGFVALRYDKRGVGESEGDKYSKGMDDLVGDIVNNIKFLKEHPKVNKDKIILIGHSEGCILSTVASTIAPVAGLILVAGAGSNLEGLIEYLYDNILDEVNEKKGIKGRILRLFINEKNIKKYMKTLYAKIYSSTKDTIRFKFKRMPKNWFKEHFRYSNAYILNTLRNSHCNILAITGSKDVQADPNHLKRLENFGKNNIKCVVIENMDHMVKECREEKTILGVIKQYKEQEEFTLHPKFKEILEEWLNEFFPIN